MLHDMGGFSGTLWVKPDGANKRMECRLSISRGSSVAQAQFTIDGQAVTLHRDKSGVVSAFQEQVQRTPTRAEAARFAMLIDLFDPSVVGAIEPGETSYFLKRDGKRFEVELERPSVHGMDASSGHAPKHPPR